MKKSNVKQLVADVLRVAGSKHLADGGEIGDILLDMAYKISPFIDKDNWKMLTGNNLLNDPPDQSETNSQERKRVKLPSE